MQLQVYLKQFLDYLEFKQKCSPQTARNYSLYLRRFLSWLQKQGINEPQLITLSLIQNFRRWLSCFKDKNNRLLCPTTQNYHLIALRSFLRYLNQERIQTLKAEKVKINKIPKRQIVFLEGTDLERFLAAPLQNLKTKTSSRSHQIAEAIKQNQNLNQLNIIQLRDKALLELLFATGLRVSELAKLRRSEINSKKNEIVILGKKNKPRLVFLSQQARFWLAKYLERRSDSEPWLFIRHDRAFLKKGEKKKKENQSLTPRSIQRLVEKYAKLAGLSKKITPHTLRHSLAANLIFNGTDLHSIQSILGHSSLASTKIYTHLAPQEKNEKR